MTPSDIQLARELVALGCWEWARGLPCGGGVYCLGPSVSGTAFGVHPVRAGYSGKGWLDACGIVVLDMPNACEIRPIPDLPHPLVKGWLLELVRRVYGDPSLSTRCLGRHNGKEWEHFPWAVYSFSEYVLMPVCAGTFPTEHAALVAALKAAP